MADYRLVDITQLETDLAAVADAIRNKNGETELLVFPEGFTQGIGAIPTGAAEAEVSIACTTSNKKLEYWHVVNGALEIETITLTSPLVVRQKFGETFVLLRTKTGYTENAVKAKITISGAAYTEQFMCVTTTSNFIGYTLYVITPTEATATISIY